jgi:acetoacetyl-CoA reductase
MSQVALVTGGSRGIGAAISIALKQAGYTVVASYAGNEEAAEQFRQQTGISVRRWDVGDYKACVQNVEEITKSLGPIDVLVNNAGITRDTMFHKMTPEQWSEVINTNLTSCFNMTRCVIDAMRERQYGRIINISSVNGQKGQVGQSNYSAAKAGVIGFTKALAQETAARGITVNAITPGYINTDMVQAIPQTILDKIISLIPVGRLGQPEEIARAVAFLASRESGFITGVTLSLNGGQYLA